MSHTLPDPILDAAQRLHRRAPAALTMGAVAREAGVSRATLYRHAGDREALLAALVRTGRIAPTAADPTRQRLLGVALQVLIDRGTTGFTVGAVARAARVDEATIYRRFGSRAKLLDTVVEELGGRRFAWKLGTDPARDPREELLEFTERVLGLGPTFTGLFRLALAAPRTERKRLQKLRRANEGTEAALATWFGTLQSRGFLVAGDRRLLARTYLALVVSLGFLQPIDGETPDLEPTVLARWIVTRFLDGASPPGAAWGDR